MTRAKFHFAAKTSGGSVTGGNTRLQALGRLPAGTMNKTEEAYSGTLEQRRLAGDILWWKFEGIKLHLAPNTFLTVDFSVLAADGLLHMIDVKGAKAMIADDAHAKMKIAAGMYPFVFSYAFPTTRLGHGWTEEVIG